MNKNQLNNIKLFINKLKELPNKDVDMYYININLNDALTIDIKPSKFNTKSIAFLIINGNKKELFECMKLIKKYINVNYKVEASLFKLMELNTVHFIKTSKYALCFKTPKHYAIFELLEQHNQAVINKNKQLIK